MCMCKIRINGFCYQSSAIISCSDYIWPSRMWSGNETIFTIPANRCCHSSKFLNLLLYDLEYGSYLGSEIEWIPFLLSFHCPCLPQVPEYAVLEKDSAPMPISTSLQSSASPTPPPLPPPLSSSPPSCSPPPPPSLPPPSSSQPPPVYSEILNLPHNQSTLVNQYTEIPTAGTTIY